MYRSFFEPHKKELFVSFPDGSTISYNDFKKAISYKKENKLFNFLRKVGIK